MSPPGTLTSRGANATDARTAATGILADLREGQLLDHSFERRTGSLDSRDRRWVQELIWGLLRNRTALDVVLQARVRGGIARLHPDLTDVLRLGVQQLLNMGGVPAYAAIAQTVELAKQRHGPAAGGLVNAVLRRIDRERGQLGDTAAGVQDTAEALSRKHSHPRWLVERWLKQFGAESTARLLEHNNRQARTVLRPWNTDAARILSELEQAGIAAAPAPLAAESVELPPGLSLGDLEPWQKGQAFVQDPAATLVSIFAAMPPDGVVADLCAAPGGKTLELSRTASFVLASDRSAPRLQRVKDNIHRLRATRIGLAVMDATAPAIRLLDGILLDAPCTGTGTFRRHPDARWRLRISDLALLAATQAGLLRSAANCVRPGGLLIYSTCSLEPEENDAQVDAFLAEHSEWSLEAPPAGTVPDEVLDDGRLRVLPQETGTDGAFSARLRRAA